MGTTLGTVLYLAAIGGIFYFMLIRPQQKKTKQLKEMQGNLKVGDRVVTIGGMVGSVARVTEDEFVLTVGKRNDELTFKKWAVSRVEDTLDKN